MNVTAQQFDRVLNALLDGDLNALSDADHATLRAGVMDQPDRRERFIEAMLMQAALLLDHASGSAPGIAPAPGKVVLNTVAPAPMHRLWRWAGAAAIAASVLIVGLLWMWGDGAREDAAPPRESAQSLAVLSASRDAMFDTRPLSPGDSLSSQVMRLTQGEVTIDYYDGTAVTLSAPAVYEITGTHAGRLTRGRMVADAAAGFELATPNFTVIDRGTRFAVWVDESTGGSVLVLEGRVDVRMTHRTGQSSVQALTAGTGMSLLPAASDSAATVTTEHGRFAVSTGDFASLPVGEQIKTWELDAQDHVSFGDVHDIGPATSQTVSLWFNSQVSGRTAFIASKGNSGSTDNGWSIWLDPAGLLMVRASYTGAGTTQNLAMNRPFGPEDVNKWHHVMVVIDNAAGTLTAYYDGLDSGDGEQNGWSVGGGGGEVNRFEPGRDFSNDHPILLGARANDISAVWTGRIDDLAVWNRALSAREASDVNRLGPTGKSQFVPMPVPLTGRRIGVNGQATIESRGASGDAEAAVK